MNCGMSHGKDFPKRKGPGNGIWSEKKKTDQRSNRLTNDAGGSGGISSTTSQHVQPPRLVPTAIQKTANGLTRTTPREQIDMVQAKKRSRSVGERAALRRRVRRMYAALNRAQWEKCFTLLDPTLRDAGRVES